MEEEQKMEHHGVRRLLRTFMIMDKLPSKCMVSRALDFPSMCDDSENVYSS